MPHDTVARQKETYIWCELQILICWSNASPRSYIWFLIHRRFRIAFFLPVYFERVSSYWRRLFWKGATCCECAEVWRAGNRNKDYRQHPAANDYVACRVLHLRCFYHSKENSNTKWPVHRFCVYVIHHRIRTWCISYFNSACMLLFFILPFLSRVAKTSSFAGAVS